MGNNSVYTVLKIKGRPFRTTRLFANTVAVIDDPNNITRSTVTQNNLASPYFTYDDERVKEKHKQGNRYYQVAPFTRLSCIRLTT